MVQKLNKTKENYNLKTKLFQIKLFSIIKVKVKCKNW